MPGSTTTSYSPVGMSTERMITIEHIYDQIGGMGRFQMAAIVLLYGAKSVFGFSMMIMSYAGYIGAFECVTTSVANQSTAALYANGTLNMTTAQPDVMNGRATSNNVCSVNGTKCQDFSFLGPRRTVVSEWHLVCDRRWLKATVTSIQMCGVMLGAILGGLSGDYFGRKKTEYGALLVHALLNIIAAYSVTWQMFAAMRFSIGTVMGMGLVMVVPYPTEFLPLRWRHVVPPLPTWPLGIMAMAGAAWWLEDWSHLHIVAAVFSAVFLLGSLYIPESPRWLATQGRVEESYAVLDKMARTNRGSLPTTTMDILKRIAQKESRSQRRNQYTYLDLFRNRQTTKLTVIFSLQWFTLALIYYGISFAVTSFVGNLYLNIFLMNTVQIPIYCVTLVIVDKLGRRGTCIVFMFISVVISFTCVGLYSSDTPAYTRDVWISGLCHLASTIVIGCWAAAQVWVTESYPTVTRSLGYGFANLASRVGSVLAPFFINLDDTPLFSFILMGATTLVSMVTTLFIPETNKKALLETLHEKMPPAARERPGNLRKPSDEETAFEKHAENGDKGESRKCTSSGGRLMEEVCDTEKI